MCELKKIILKVLVLILDIILLGYKVVKQVILPNRKRRGNLLSSLFVFFIGIIERLNIFEHGLFSMADLFSKKYVKQTIFAIGFILFLLSLLEWTGDVRVSHNIASTSIQQFLLNTKEKTNASNKQLVFSPLELTLCYQQLASNFACGSSPTYTLHEKKFLLNCSLRI